MPMPLSGVTLFYFQCFASIVAYSGVAISLNTPLLVVRLTIHIRSLISIYMLLLKSNSPLFCIQIGEVLAGEP